MNTAKLAGVDNTTMIETWVLFEKPRDFPNEWVVRRMWTRGDKLLTEFPIYARGRTRDECEKNLFSRNPRIPTLKWFDRTPQDEPQIVGCWF